MKLIAILLLMLMSSFAMASELEDISKLFVAAAKSGNSDQLKKIYLDTSTRDTALLELEKTLPQIQSKKLNLSNIKNELVIGDLGVTLIRVDFADQPEPKYRPLICVRTKNGWRVFPWSTQDDLKTLYEQRTPEEQIHLKLFNKWGQLIKPLLKPEAEQAVPGQSARSAPVKN